MHITINNPTFNFHAGPPALASALVVALLRGDEQDEPDANAPVAAQAAQVVPPSANTGRARAASSRETSAAAMAPSTA